MDTGIKKTIYSTVNKHKENLISISEFIHQNPELCYEEYKAVSKLTDYLKKEGCVVKERFCGIDTSFISTHTVGNPKYHFAICAEYDALPKIGHACGHNIICTAALGAYLATKITMDKHGIEGKVSLIGTPAEEGGGGKIKIIDKTDSVDELRKIYSSATYFVNPTFNDTFPTVNIEALACGTPVITFKTGGSPESITSKTGLVIDEKNAEYLSDIIASSPCFKSSDCVQQAKTYERKDKYKEYLSFFNKNYW